MINRMLGTLLFAIPLLTASPAVAADDNTFTNHAVGFTITKPAEWHFMTAEQNLENLKMAKFKDEQVRELIVKYSTTPLVVMTRYQEPFDDLNPSIKVNTRPYGELKGIEAKQILQMISKQFPMFFKDYELVQPPTYVTLAGIETAYMRLNYTLEVPDGRAFATTSELWIVPRENYYFAIGAGTRTDEKTGTRADIARILESARFE